jgi:hypothetical protein
MMDGTPRPDASAQNAPFETPGPHASAKRKRKKAAWEPKPPTEWLRTTPMGRQEIVDELVGLPDHYIQDPEGKGKDGKPTKGAGKRIPVPAACCKAVLRCIAGWDEPGSKFYRSNDNIAHCTGWPVSMVNKANLALKQVGLLTKEWRGWNMPSLSDLDWDAMQRYRKRYCPKPGIDEKLPTPADDPDKDEGQPGSVKEPQPAAELPGNLDPLTVEVLARFEKVYKAVVQARLPALEVDKMIAGMRKLNDEETIQVAISGLDNRQLEKVMKAEKNSVGYLRTVLTKLIAQGVEVVPDHKEESEEEKAMSEFSIRVAKYFTTRWVDDDDKANPPSDHLAPWFYEAIMSEPHPKGSRIVHYLSYGFEQDGKYFRGVSLDQAARTFLKQLPGLVTRYHDQYLDPFEDSRMAEEFAAIWAGKASDTPDSKGKVVWLNGPSSPHLVAILRQPLVGNPGRDKNVLLIEYAFKKDPDLRTVSLEEAAETFVEKLPAWIAQYDKEPSEEGEKEEDDDDDDDGEEDDGEEDDDDDDSKLRYDEEKDRWLG